MPSLRNAISLFTVLYEYACFTLDAWSRELYVSNRSHQANHSEIGAH